MENKNKIITLTAVAALVVAAIGTSFAYFTANINGGESASTIVATGGRMTIVYDDLTGEITANNIYPRDAAWVTKNFTVTGTNTTDETMYYKLGLEVITNTFTDNALSYSLTSTNTSNNGTVVLSQQNIGIRKSFYFGTGSFVKGENKVHTYKFELFFKDTELPQNEDQGKSFSAHIIIEAAKSFGVPDGWNEAASGTLLAGIKSNNANEEKTLTVPGQAKNLANEAVLAAAEDDYGTSYYFRGAVENNYVEFANKCWRIVRITGNGAIKLVLYNDNLNNVADPCEEEGGDLAFSRYYETDRTLYYSMFNEEYDNNAYVGLMYGDINGTTYDAVHANNTDSTILTDLKAWYDLSFTDNQKSMLADVIYCNDKSIVEFDGILSDGVGTNDTIYGPYGRLLSMTSDGNLSLDAASPNLVCPNTGSDGKLSKFTASDTTYGNGKLRGVNGVGTNEYKVGLLTPDEVALAGSIFGFEESAFNSDYYLYKNTEIVPYWWLSAASVFDGGIAVDWIVGIGALYCNLVYNEGGLRGVVSLKSNTAISGGTGTYDDPFVVNG